MFVLTDTRHRESTVKMYTTQIKELLGPQTRCIHSPIAPHATKKGYQSSVGGQLVIISHTWSGALIDHFNDPSNLGMVSGIRLATGGGSLLIMGNYWPFPTKDDISQGNGLWARASQFLNRKKIKNPLKNTYKTSSRLIQIGILPNLHPTLPLYVETLIIDGIMVNISFRNGPPLTIGPVPPLLIPCPQALLFSRTPKKVTHVAGLIIISSPLPLLSIRFYLLSLRMVPSGMESPIIVHS